MTIENVTKVICVPDDLYHLMSSCTLTTRENRETTIENIYEVSASQINTSYKKGTLYGIDFRSPVDCYLEKVDIRQQNLLCGAGSQGVRGRFGY